MSFPTLLSALLVTLTSLLAPAVLAQKNHPVSGEPLADKQVFTYSYAAEPPSIDPQLIEDVIGKEIANDLFEGLVVQAADGSIQPGVATHWTISDDKRVYTFHLRDNARWSNGDPVTAHDFEFAWKRSVNPELASPQASYMGQMSVLNGTKIKQGKAKPEALGVRAVDDLTFEVTLEQPLAYFPSMLIASVTMPVHKATIQQHGKYWTQPGKLVGNGAYRLAEHVLNEKMVRQRNPYYWNNANTLIDTVIARVIPDEQQQLNRYFSDEIDVSDIPSGQYQRLKKKYPQQVHSDPLLCSYYYYFNVEQPPLDDIRVRAALSYAIDRDIITNHILGSGQTPGYTLTPAKTNSFSPPENDFTSSSQQQRNLKAKQLLQSAGYHDDNPLQATLIYNTSEGHKKIAIAISQMWKKTLGVNITLENQEWKTFLNTRQHGDYQIARSGFCGFYNEPSAFLATLKSDSRFNDSNYRNPLLDTLLDQAQTGDQPEEKYQQIEKIITTDFPVAPIYHYTSVKIVKPWLKGWPFENIQNNWYSKDLYIMKH